jgi:hypothetical protein
LGCLDAHAGTGNLGGRSAGRRSRLGLPGRQIVTLKGPVPSGELRISIEQLPSVAVVQVSGEVDIATTPRLTGALEAAQRADANVALDITGVEFLDFNRVGGADRADRRATADGHRA